MDKPNLNLRRLRLVDGLYTVEPPAEALREFVLCDFCGLISKCSIRENIRAIGESFGLRTEIRACRLYVPTLSFRKPHIGLVGRFNTFRLGMAATRRYRVGGLVSFVDSETSEEVGSGVVESIHHGTLDQMLKTHAALNHLMLDKPSHTNHPAELRKMLDRAYGRLIVREAKAASVVYLTGKPSEGARDRGDTERAAALRGDC